MLNDTSLNRKHLPTSMSISHFFILTTDLIEGCTLGVVLGTKKDEVTKGIVEVKAKETFSVLALPPPQILQLVPIQSQFHHYPIISYTYIHSHQILQISK